MGFSLSGYVVEKPRVGAANSSFTASPDNFISDYSAYSSIYGSDESTPGRTEYLTLVLVDGDFPVAEFGWTKNEGGLQRFDYDGTEGKFRPLPGSTRVLVGSLALDSNANRLKVSSKPVFPAATSPFRLSLGEIGSGSTLSVSLVDFDSEFTVISTPNVVQLSLETGNLNWNETDLTVNLGQKVFYQQQSFFTLRESKGHLGVTGVDTILLNPIPGQGPTGGSYQAPLLRFGFGLYLTPISVVNEVSFSEPIKGSFQWSRDTGKVRFNAEDLVENDGEPVYYDGVLFEKGKGLSKQAIGTVSSPSIVNPIPLAGGDLVFRAVNTSACPSGTGTLTHTSLLTDSGADFSAAGVSVGDSLLITSGPYVGARRLVTIVNATTLQVSPPFPGVGSVGYRVEVAASVHQFPITTRVTAFTPPGATGAVQVHESTGAVQFSLPDQITYGSWAVEAINGDLVLERGLSLRFFRSPVDLEGVDPLAKDFSSFYPTEDAQLANPVIGAPMVFLPVLPVDDPAYPIVYEVRQGTGSFVGLLPRLDVENPPLGYGYTLDFDSKQLVYSFRRNNEVHQIPTITGTWALQPLINSLNASFELDQGSGFLPIHLVGDPVEVSLNAGDAILDSNSGVLSFVDEVGTLVLSSSGGEVASGQLGILYDAGADFSSVIPNNLLLITSGEHKGVYTVETVPDTTHLTFSPPLSGAHSGISYEIREDHEVLADRFFSEVTLVDPNVRVEKIRLIGVADNSTRIVIEKSLASVTRFRFGSNRFSTETRLVSTDMDFTTIASSGVVEISLETGSLNFFDGDLGSQVYQVWTLSQGRDYRVSAELGMFQLSERLLALDEVFLTYPSEEDNPDLTVSPLTLTEERGTFLIRKELTEHPTDTSTISFNLHGRTVAPTPKPVVFRGGRPQDETQVAVDPARSVISFLPDSLPTPTGMLRITDALPHGSVVGAGERVYIDYNIYEALGGENTITVQKPPFVITPVTIREGGTSFTVRGDFRSLFAADYLLRIEQEQLYYLGEPSYDPPSDTTTVNLALGQGFRDDFTNPRLYRSSGPTRLNSFYLSPAYFVPDITQFESMPRGMTRVLFFGDVSGSYRTGTVLNFSGSISGVSYSEFYLVSGSKYKAEVDRTEVTFTQTAARQYTLGQVVLRRSVRPIYEDSLTKIQTSSSPVIPPSPVGVDPYTLLDTVTVYRRIEGAPGVILSSPVDFKIDDAGKVEISSPLISGEEISILYSRYRAINPGQLRASYTHTISPNSENGLLNQILVGTFTTLVPDSFYFRVETMGNYRGELAKKYSDEAKSSVPSSGPRVDNASQPKLHEQGQKSVFFDEGAYSNEDIVARTTLKNYNDTINTVEDILCSIDGRVVGDWDGRFRFDGTTGSVVSDFSLASNQIDDRVKISEFPVVFDPTPTFLGTYVQAYQPGAQSRFFPMHKTGVGKTLTGKDQNAETGAQLMDFEVKSITGSDPTVFRRFPRARIIRSAKAGSTTLHVDTTEAFDAPPFRPGFVSGMKVVIQDPSGTYYVPQETPLTVGLVTTTSLTVDALPQAVPAGATVFLGVKDQTYQKSYRVGTDVALDNEKGYLLYVKPYPPLDGSVPSVPEQLCIQAPNQNELLQGAVNFSNGLTAPKKIPALYGQDLDDDGDQRIPLIGPELECEGNSGNSGYSDIQLEYVAPTGHLGTLPAPFVGTGALNAVGTTVTLASGSFPSPAPQAGDLLRVLDGANGPSSFHRVLSVGSNWVLVENAFGVKPTSGFQFLITTSNNLKIGSFTVMSGTTLTDPTGQFIANGIKPGYTVVLTNSSHTAKYQRRQVVAILSETQLQVDFDFIGVVLPETYRICNPLSTYSHTDNLVELSSAAGGLVAILNDEIASADAFFSSVFTARFPGLVSGTFSGSLLTGAGGVDFQANHVQAGDYVYASYPQGSAGVFQVVEVISANVLRVKDPPPPGGASFQVASAFGVTEKSLKAVYAVRKSALDFVSKPSGWQSLASTDISVLGPSGSVDPDYFARGFGPLSVTTWYTDLSSRQGTISTSVADLEAILASSDRLYDKRYAWIDARINLEKGILVKQQRAVSERLKAQADMYNQLIKLLSVG